MSDWDSNQELFKCSAETSPLITLAPLDPTLSNSFIFDKKKMFQFALKINANICFLLNKG